MVTLTEKFLSDSAGWEAAKSARALLEAGRVLSSNWTPPILRGVVQEGGASYRAGLVIKDSIDIENMCTCRESRQWGKICAHSVAVGLHHLRGEKGGLPVSKRPEPEVARNANSRSEGGAGRRVLRSASADQGTRATLCFIFPPNFIEAIPRNKVMVCVEAETESGRGPLNSLPAGQPFAFNQRDSLILDRLEEWAGGETPGMIFLSAMQFDQLLGLLGGHENVALGRKQKLEVSSEPIRLPIRASLENSGEVILKLGTAERAFLVAGKRAWFCSPGRVAPASLSESVLSLAQTGATRLGRDELPAFLSRDFAVLSRDHDVAATFSTSDFEVSTEPVRVRLDLDGGLAGLEAELKFLYPNMTLAAGSGGGAKIWMPLEGRPMSYRMRDVGAEQEALNVLVKAGFSAPDSSGKMRLQGQENVLRFFARLYPELENRWETHLRERLQTSRQRNIEVIRPRLRVTGSGQNWFDLEVGYDTEGGEQFSPADIQKLLLSGQSHSRLRNGKFAVIDTDALEEFQETLRDCRPEQTGKAYRIGQQQAAFLNASVNEHRGWAIEGGGAWRDSMARFDVKREGPSIPGELARILRGYQVDGVKWIHWLSMNGFAGILADEMGLGKTLQALAFLSSRKRGVTALEREMATLIVCPTSLVFNWVNEAARFTPELRVLDLTGAGRASRFPEIARHDLCITTYGLLRRDLEFLKTQEFSAVILDEAQHIKNRQTQNAQAVKALRASFRLVLTGTPMENSVLDLWSIFDFLMPGYLGSAVDFRERYEIPIVKERDSASQRRLARRLRPFILRRLKKEVVAELPERIDQVAFCDLSDEQRGLYRELLAATRREVSEAVEVNGFNKSRVLIFTALLRLRQVCCDPRLLKIPGAEFKEASGKLEMLSELVEEVVDGGHRVLIFSQFVEMLQMIRESLEKAELDYCYLDGSTRNRAEVVDRFQRADSIPVFLISLKAGGVGLNLTGADTVIHFDPWWNPAVEQQATDRAHRIGQTRVVTSYKLIARGTIEEKILQLQARKKELIQGLIDGEESFAGALAWDEIQELLRD